MHLNFQAGPKILGISWEDTSLGDTIPLLFSPWQTSNGRATGEFMVERAGSGYRLSGSGGQILCPDREILTAHLEYNLTNAALEGFVSHLQIHASSIDLNGNGALVIGPHGAGKTTFALAALSRGYRALGDDVAIVDADGINARGFPRPFRVTPGTLAFSPGVIPTDCPRFPVHEMLTYVFFTFPAGKYYTPVTRLRHVFFPVRRPGPVQILELGKAAALNRILSQGFNFDKRIETIARDLLQLLERAAPLEIAYGDHWEAVETVRGLLS